VGDRAFSMFGERGKFLISGGNDKLVKVWNWSLCLDAGLSEDGNNDILHLNIEVPRKVSFCYGISLELFDVGYVLCLCQMSIMNSFVHFIWQVNWLCTTSADTDNLVVCDTSKVVKVYSIA